MRRVLAAWIITSAVVGSPVTAIAQQGNPSIRIELGNDTAIEREGREQLVRILSTWDLSRWLFTRTIRVEAEVIPNSHPVLTVNTRYLSNDTAQVATFLHEQIHWFFVQHRAATDSAIADLQNMYPDAPDGPPDGARDRYSTYLHLLVCLLEFDAVRDLFDEDVARRTLRGWRHYSWIYREVLENPAPNRDVLRRYRLDSPDARMGTT